MHSGVFKGKYQCNRCKQNKNFKSAWGCEGKCSMSIPTFEYIEKDVHYKLWSCPVKFIPNNVSRFFLILGYYKDFPGAKFPSIEDVSLRFYSAYKMYENYYAEYEQLMKDH